MPESRDTSAASRRPSLFVGRGVWGALAWAFIVVFATLAFAQAVRTGSGWGTALGMTALTIFYTFLPWVEAANARARRVRVDGTLTVNDWGVTRVAGKIHEAVAWADLAWVRIYTTSDGPLAEDMFFALGSSDGTGCLVPNGLAVASGLLAELQARLPGLDNSAVARAAGSCTEASFTLWTRRVDSEAPPMHS